MKLEVRGSALQDFLDCRQKWSYRWVEGIEPVRPNNKLFFGTLFHKFLEEYFIAATYKVAYERTMKWFQEQNTSDMAQLDIDEMMEMFNGVSHHYHMNYYEEVDVNIVLGTEVKFRCKLDEDTYYDGMIDLVYLNHNGQLCFMDHKTASSISFYEEKAVMDRQISRYWFVMEAFIRGEAYVLNELGEWVEWGELKVFGEVHEFVYNIIKKVVPKEPKVLKNGTLSKAKDQVTTYAMYYDAIRQHGLDMDDYQDILEILSSKDDYYFKRIHVKRNESEVQHSMLDFYAATKDMRRIHNEESEVYRNVTDKCKMCQYRPLCETVISGGNERLTRSLQYRKVEEQ